MTITPLTAGTLSLALLVKVICYGYSLEKLSHLHRNRIVRCLKFTNSRVLEDDGGLVANPEGGDD